MPGKILIVGAGASGLMAAHILTENGFSVTIVEARDRSGGRIHTFHEGFPIPVEEGAEFIHGKQPLTLSLLRRAESEVYLISGELYQKWNGKLETGDILNGQWSELTEAMEGLKEDIDMRTFLDTQFGGNAYRSLRKRVRGFVEGYDAADLRRVSALALREEWSGNDDENQFRIVGGYSTLIHFLENSVKEKGGEVLLSSPVAKILWRSGEVSVITEDGKQLTGDKLIVTVSLGVLMKDHLTFSPALPRHREAFAAMGFGGVIKVFFQFVEPFWEDRIAHPLKNASFVFSDAEIPTWWSQLPEKIPMLTGWLGGPATGQIKQPTHLYKTALSSLQYLTDMPAKEIEKRITKYHMKDWLADPYSFGAYAFPTVGSLDALATVRDPVHQTLYFAGEALYEGKAMGTVEAALVNGKQVAEKIVAEN